MFRSDAPKTIEQARKYRYNQWAGNPNGRAYQEGYCAFEKMNNYISSQCQYKNGKGINGLYCGRCAKKVSP